MVFQNCVKYSVNVNYIQAITLVSC